jgi:uncharacterized protein YecE (DUF72 family)
MNGFPFYVGTSGWTYDHWKGDFYPEKLAKTRWFSYYASQFTAVEVNATFYRNFADSTYQKWRERVETGFRYVLKVPRLITHYKRLEGCEDEMRSFWRSAQLLNDRLGMILLQLAPDMPCDLEKLEAALLTYDDPGLVAVEFRAECWQDTRVRSLLERLGAAFVSVDSPKSHPTGWVTGRRAYIRLHGRKRWYAYNYEPGELNEIAALARQMQSQGAQEVYIFFNNDVGVYAPQNALALKELLAKG